MTRIGVEYDGVTESMLAIMVAHVSHLLSALVLYRLGLLLCKRPRLAFVAALLHVLSPAGLFLSAPYAESPFAFLSFGGHLLFAMSCLGNKRSVWNNARLVAAGVLFGLASTFRSNGILNGILFAIEFFQEARQLAKFFSFAKVQRLVAIVVGGLAVAAGVVVPQIVAYQRFCLGSLEAVPRPWCMQAFPSIYSFVQGHYW